MTWSGRAAWASSTSWACPSRTPGRARDLLVVGPSGHRSRLPAFAGRAYPGHGVVIPRVVLDDALRTAAIEAGAEPIRARVSGVDARPAARSGR